MKRKMLLLLIILGSLFVVLVLMGIGLFVLSSTGNTYNTNTSLQKYSDSSNFVYEGRHYRISQWIQGTGDDNHTTILSAKKTTPEIQSYKGIRKSELLNVSFLEDGAWGEGGIYLSDKWSDTLINALNILKPQTVQAIQTNQKTNKSKAQNFSLVNSARVIDFLRQNVNKAQKINDSKFNPSILKRLYLTSSVNPDLSIMFSYEVGNGGKVLIYYQSGSVDGFGWQVPSDIAKFFNES